MFFCLFFCCLVSPIKLTSFLLSWKRNLITSFQLWKKLVPVWNHSDRSWSFHFVEHPTPDVDMVSKIECIRSFVSIFLGILLLFPPSVSVLCHLKFGKIVGMKHIYAKGCCLFVFFLYGFSFILNSNLRSIWSKWMIFNFTIFFHNYLAKYGLFLIFFKLY